MLTPPSPFRRERILVMGGYGTGKTSAWLNIALWSQKTGAPSRFYAMDSEYALEAFLESDSQYAHLSSKRGGNVEFTQINTWQDFTGAADYFAPRITTDDWLVIDFISPAWDLVQEYYIEQVFSERVDDYFLNARKLLKGSNPLDGWKDWSQINRLYRTWFNQVFYRTPGHKFIVASAEPIQDTDDKAIKATFAAVKVRPKGQKAMGHAPHTVLLAQSVRPGEIYLSTVKDREREALKAKELSQFTLDYLVAIGGWTL